MRRTDALRVAYHPEGMKAPTSTRLGNTRNAKGVTKTPSARPVDKAKVAKATAQETVHEVMTKEAAKNIEAHPLDPAAAQCPLHVAGTDGAKLVKP